MRWVDEDGVTQFTDGQFSAGPATVVQVQPANGMVVPISPETHRGGSPAVTRIAMAPKKNKRGWRGYSNRSQSGGSKRRGR
ncbi:MAG: hypothetical protein VB948_16800 [Pseudomonadales bacterium]